MKKIIWHYYFIPFVGFLLLLALKGLGLKSPNSFLENVVIVVGGALLLSAVVGTIYYFLDTKWGPAKQKRKLLKPPFSDLLASGFRTEENFVVGAVNNYTVVVFYTWPGGKSAIQVDVLFDPRTGTDFRSMGDVIELEKRNKKSSVWTDNNLHWTRNSIGHSMAYTFKAPSHQKILSKAEEMIGILNSEKLRPISYEENEQLMPGLLNHIEDETNKKEISKF